MFWGFLSLFCPRTTWKNRLRITQECFISVHYFILFYFICKFIFDLGSLSYAPLFSLQCCMVNGVFLKFCNTSTGYSKSLIMLIADHTSVSRQGRNRRPKRRRNRLPPLSSRASSFSSITDSTMSLNIITVTLNMDTVNFLGISIVGQSHQGGDGGIYVGSIMKG